MDNLPVAVLRQRRDGSQSTTYEHGFRVGFKGNYAGVSLPPALKFVFILANCPYFNMSICLLLQSKAEKYFINNHLSFRVMYHRDLETDSARIVGFEVTPHRFYVFHSYVYLLKLSTYILSVLFSCKIILVGLWVLDVSANGTVTVRKWHILLIKIILHMIF